MTCEVPSLSGKVFTNKTRQGVWIMRMEEGFGRRFHAHGTQHGAHKSSICQSLQEINFLLVIFKFLV
jgi:hypothetical protein